MTYAQKGSIQIEPAYIEVVLDQKSSEKQFDVTVKNNSSKNISLDIFPIDFQSSGVRGGITFLGQEASSYSYSLSSFLSFETNRLDIDSGEQRKLTVTVRNRPNLSPGGHYAAVVARLANDSKTSDANIISPALSSLIFMRKEGGEIFNLSIREVDFPSSAVSFGVPREVEAEFQNDGNVHVVPYGKLEIKDIFGRIVYKGVLNTSSAIVMPETRRIIATQVKKTGWMLPISLNEVSITGTDSLKKTSYLHKDSFFYINPFVLIIFFILIAYLIIRKRKQRERRQVK